MSPILSTLEFRGLAYYCDPRRLIVVDKGSFGAMAWLKRVLSSPQFSKVRVGPRLA